MANKCNLAIHSNHFQSIDQVKHVLSQVNNVLITNWGLLGLLGWWFGMRWIGDTDLDIVD
jgi:hypothetical protein